MLGISGGDPAFRDDDGSADPQVVATLAAFAAGQGSEVAVLTALAAGRLLVPVVAVLVSQLEAAAGARAEPGAPPWHEAHSRYGAVAGSGDSEAEASAAGSAGYEPGKGEKASEMAMPTLIGLDGRRAIPAFTCLETMQRWQPDARPVPVAARHLWQAARGESCAVVIDVAGPVPFAVEGARLAALARGEAAPPPFADPDIREVVADVLASRLMVAAFELEPGDEERDLVIALTLAPASTGADMTELANEIGNAVMARLASRLRRGVAISLAQASR